MRVRYEGKMKLEMKWQEMSGSRYINKLFCKAVRLAHGSLGSLGGTAPAVSVTDTNSFTSMVPSSVFSIYFILVPMVVNPERIPGHDVSQVTEHKL